ncbi:hypothetical protein H3M14_08520 [Latilactobacillus sakei]|uniref:metallophosphoesterase family protein n=1 Tax=Latilactobacillus sakei TaxID=1599 RepID=UPI0015F5C381|nr:hypothetical protein [Latilactobacillus sakei]QMU86123.1 hypothetical protein H3M14_08520 [Latilactobacillus sakei]
MKIPKFLNDLWDEPSPFQNREARNQKQHNWDVLRRFGQSVGGFLSNAVGEVNNAVSDASGRMDDIEDRYDGQIAGNTDLDEIIDSRKPKGKPAFKTLGERLNYEFTLDDALLIGKPISTEHKVMADNIMAKVNREAFNFVFITDQHYGSQSELIDTSSGYGLDHTNNALYLDGKVDVIIAGGDNIDGHNNSYDALLNDQKQFALGFLGNTTNFSDKFMLKGNHDDGSWRVYAFRNGTLPEVKTMPQIIGNNILKKDYRNAELLFGEIRNGDSNYFYKDYRDKKVRLIGVDSNDTPTILAEDGGPKYPGINYMGYRQEQLNWLANTALQGVPEDYTTIIVSHEGAVTTPHDNDLSDPAHGHHTNQAEFNRIINDFINGGSGLVTNYVKDNEIAVQTDFTNQGKRILAGYIHGHDHKESHTDSVGFNDIGIINSFGPSRYGDNDGWNLISLDTDNRKLILHGFGTATDREFTY